jgi:hypothetical protein
MGTVVLSGVSKTEATKIARAMSGNKPGTVIARPVKHLGREHLTVDYFPDEKRAIKALAASNKPPASIREEAIAAHRALLRRVNRSSEKLPYGNPYFEFMREVDCPLPDLLLRYHRRQQVLAAHI